MRLSDGALAELTALTADERTAVMRALEAGDRDADEAGAPAPDLPVARPITPLAERIRSGGRPLA